MSKRMLNVWNDIEPLASEIWFERIEAIARRELPSTENSLRHALHLLQLTPLEFRPPDYRAIDEAAYEALLDAGDLDAAARCLVDAPTLTVHASPITEGVRIAMRCSTLNRTFTAEGSSLADAVLQAWAECLLLLRSVEPGWLKANEL